MIVELLDNGCVVWGAWGAGVLRGGRGQPFRGVHEWPLRETSRTGKNKNPFEILQDLEGDFRADHRGISEGPRR